MAVIDSQLQQAPKDPDVLAWRARLLLWAGRPSEAELEWKQVLALAPQDPDNWLGLANVYLQQGRPRQALKAVNNAVELDPSRADLHVAKANILLALQDPTPAQLEFRRATELDPSDAQAKAGLLSLRAPPKHRLLFGTETDLFSFPGVYQQNDITLLSQWSANWKTTVGGGVYQRGGLQATKFDLSLTKISRNWGALTAGGTAAHDNGFIPRNEAFFEYDHGWKVSGAPVLHGVEIIYGQHWYWYSNARVLAVTEATVFYLPRDWTWTFGLTGARSKFDGPQPRWSPSASSRLGFPILARERHRLEGNAFFASGTEDFAQVDQIGSFSSRTCGGGIRLQMTRVQDIASFAAYQTRSSRQSQTSFGVIYGLRF